MSQYSRQVVDGILSVVSTLLPPLNRLPAAAKGGLLIPANYLFLAASLSSHDNAGAQLGAVQFLLAVYSLYFADNF